MTALPPPLPHPPPRPQRPRQGPRPLALHLSMAMATLMTSPAGLPFLKSGWLPWKPPLRERGLLLQQQVGAVAPEALAQAVDREMRRRVDAVLTGLERYRHHPYRRELPDPPTIWQESNSRLLAYGAEGASGPAVLFIPSLVNRAYVLDLMPGRSLLRWLAAEGFRPYLLDWGAPGPLERRFSLTDYIAGRLERGLEVAVTHAGGPLPLVGYCMGGLLALAAALRRPREISGLVVMATPWDFHAEDPAGAQRAAQLLAPFGPWLDAWGEMPVDMLQTQFAALDPLLALKKFAQFGRMPPDSPQARAFVALEDWLNDGIPLAAAVARECVMGWYGHNSPACGQWLVAGAPVRPETLRMPALALIPERDRIVPPTSARALALAIPGAEQHNPPLGHIGMVVSAGGEKGVWRPLAGWLRRIHGGACAGL